MNSSLLNQKHGDILLKIREFPWFKKYFDPDVLTLLGKGAFGVVVSTKLLTNPLESIALKIVIPESQALLKDYIKEINFMTLLDNHANICEIQDSIIDSFDRTVVIRMSQAESSLKNVIDREKQLKNGYLLQVLADIANALAYAHSKGIYHLDIKPANILIFRTEIRENLPKIQKTHVFDGKIVFKLSDWGGGVLNSKGKTTLISDLFASTPGYMAPEISNGEDKLNLAACDIYSLGMSLLICCGQKYENIKHISSISREKAKKHDFEIQEAIDEIKDNYSQNLIDLIQRMLKFDHSTRIALDMLIMTLENLSESTINETKEEETVKNLKNFKKLDQKKEIESLMRELALDIEKWANYEIKTKDLKMKLELNSEKIVFAAAKDENGDALFILGIMQDGAIQIDGYHTNTEIAFDYFAKSAAKNNPFGLLRLGFSYLFGKGTKENYEKAFYFIDLSARCSENNRTGLTFRGYCFDNGIGVKKDSEKAVADYMKALSLGHEFPCWNLAVLYENKILKDDTGLKKIEYYKLGMDKNDADCRKIL